MSLNQLKADIAAGTVDRDPGNKVFMALLSMVDSTPETIENLTKFEPASSEARTSSEQAYNQDIQILVSKQQPNDPVSI